MPYAPPRVCARCGKPAPKNRPCTCRPAWEGSTHDSGNDRQWQAARDAYLATHQMCEWPTGCIRLADIVDHVIPLAEGGAKYDPRNFMALCHGHHTEKTTADAQRGKTRAR
ncbi:HNH endonuclease signature motif containing protein [Mycolicibacterium peregrinum]|uniref:HNH endonuclease signature motif containing protein n=1 Tax=Mycolicibacterium peregrinum TaxID=43304 RepID=UPI000AB8B2B2|nr:HNH endonuclease signature motif containing protein [Mycolicibacterium peregrinum]